MGNRGSKKNKIKINIKIFRASAMYIVSDTLISTNFLERNLFFLQNFHTRKLSEISLFYAASNDQHHITFTLKTKTDFLTFPIVSSYDRYYFFKNI